jgi:hypothetical protein
MIEISVTLDDGMYFPMFVFIPTGSEVMRRLSLKCEWSYAMSGTHPSYPGIFSIFYDTILQNGTRIKLFKQSVEPVIDYKRLDDHMLRIRDHYIKCNNTKPILMWMNYDIFYNPSQPLCLFFLEKKMGKWSAMIKTSPSFDQVEEAMLDTVFYTLGCVWDRFFELKEYYSL